MRVYRDYYPCVFVYRQYHVLGIKIVLCEPLAYSVYVYMILAIHKDTRVIISLSYNLKLNTTCFEKRNLSKQ